MLFSILLELATLISGFILPRLIIGTFGSEMNGMLHSITSFIGYVVLLQSGVGSVIKASLYKPLTQKDNHSLSIIIVTVEKFFRKIAWITVGYIFFLAAVYPLLYAQNLDFFFTASLVIIIGISTVSQYYFGMVYRMLVEADMRSHIYSIFQIATIVVHTLFTIAAIRLGLSLHMVKLLSASVFVLRPIILNIYVQQKYPLDKTVSADNSLLKQRWDGFAHAIAYFIHSKADVFVLSTFSKLENVSVYGVYAMITTGLTAFVKAIDYTMGSVFGNIIASKEKRNLKLTFSAYNTLMHILLTTVFATTAITICDFIRLYTSGIRDANYFHPFFSLIFVSAEFLYCLRLPYNSVIYAAGLFKETKKSAILEAGINIVLSCLLVSSFQLTGVALGTLCAMIYRIVSFAFFVKKQILFLSLRHQCKRFLCTTFIYVLLVFTAGKIPYSVTSFFSWCVYALSVFLGVLVVTLAVNALLFKKDFKIIFQKLRFQK